jgi:MerR family transcriptional regulator, thiopeptide resistance regulator
VYSVKQLSTLANISIRTLHYYDEIGLLHPTKIEKNGYRFYDDQALLKLQQILFYREIGFELSLIKDILNSPKFDITTALRSHRDILNDKILRLQELIQTVDNTLEHISGETPMSHKKIFKAFNDEQQKEYEREARLQYGADNVNESVRRWNGYGTERQQEIMEEGRVLYLAIAEAMNQQLSPNDEKVQSLMQRWHDNIRHFYEPTLEILRGLADLYNDDERFKQNFNQIHPRLTEYMREAILVYVDDLETKEIERLIEEDNNHNRLSL